MKPTAEPELHPHRPQSTEQMDVNETQYIVVVFIILFQSSHKSKFKRIMDNKLPLGDTD